MAFEYIDWRDLADGGDSVEVVLDKMQRNMEEAYNRAYSQSKEAIFSRNGTLVVAPGVGRRYPFDDTHITDIRASVNTAPSGSPIVLDINKNGQSIYVDQSRRPTIPSGEETIIAPLPDDVNILVGDYLTMDIDQVGSTDPGADLTVQIRYEPI